MVGEVAGSIQPMEHFSHSLAVRDMPDPGTIRESGLIIWNLDTGELPSELRLNCKKDAVLVVCGERQWTDRLAACDLEAADEVWTRPLIREQVRVRIKRFLEVIKLRRDLYMTQNYLDTAIDSIPDMLWFKSLDGTHVKVNKAFCSVVGREREDVTGRGHCYIWGVSPDDLENGEDSCKESEDAVIRARRTLQFTEEVKCSQGMRQLRTYKSPIIDMDGTTILGTVGIGHDVTDLGNMSTEIEILLQSMPYAILLWNNKGMIVNVNAKFEEYFQTLKEQVLGEDYYKWRAGTFEEQHTINSEGYLEARAALRDGTEKMLEIHENSIYDIFNLVVGILCIFRDVTTERDLERQILKSSNTDFLTGLYNRRYFYQYIHDHRWNRAVSLMYIDLDRFKGVNDTYGHKVGDAVLSRTAVLLTECFPNDFVARLGGDEFLVARLGDCTVERLELEAGGFLDRMTSAFQESDQMCTVSASIGIAQSNRPDLDVDVLLQRSDLALYEAKRKGRSRYCVYQEKDE